MEVELIGIILVLVVILRKIISGLFSPESDKKANYGEAHLFI